MKAFGGLGNYCCCSSHCLQTVLPVKDDWKLTHFFSLLLSRDGDVLFSSNYSQWKRREKQAGFFLPWPVLTPSHLGTPPLMRSWLGTGLGLTTWSNDLNSSKNITEKMIIYPLDFFCGGILPSTAVNLWYRWKLCSHLPSCFFLCLDFAMHGQIKGHSLSAVLPWCPNLQMIGLQLGLQGTLCMTMSGRSEAHSIV